MKDGGNLETPFAPCVSEFGVPDSMNYPHTEMVLADAPTVWRQTNSWVDLGYDFNGNLIAIRVPGHVARSAPIGRE